MALWIIGPPFVGKSTLARQLSPNFEVPLSGDGERCQVRGVVVDGGHMRNAHEVFSRWLESPHWQSAHAAMKSVFNREKDQMCTEAVSQRKHVVIGRRLTDLNKGLTEIEELTWQGYTNHVIAVVAPLEDCQRRAEAGRHQCEPSAFEQSISAIPPLIAACNGHYEVAQAVERDGIDRGMDFNVLARGRGSRINVPATSLMFSTDTELDEAAVREAIQKGLRRAPDST